MNMTVTVEANVWAVFSLAALVLAVASIGDAMAFKLRFMNVNSTFCEGQW